MNCFVLAAFARPGGCPAPLVGLFTGDEEIGSPEGRPVIEEAARGARAVFNSEPGRPSGAVVTGRKGGVFSVIRIEGRAAHSGGNFEHGISAIEELARKVQGPARDHRPCPRHHRQRGPGQRRPERQHRRALGRGAARPALRGAGGPRRGDGPHPGRRRARLRARHARRPGDPRRVPAAHAVAPEARRLLDLYAEAARASSFETAGEFVGGCADSGFTAAVGAPTLCAVGPVGGKAHTPDEYLRSRHAGAPRPSLRARDPGPRGHRALAGGQGGGCCPCCWFCGRGGGACGRGDAAWVAAGGGGGGCVAAGGGACRVAGAGGRGAGAGGAAWTAAAGGGTRGAGCGGRGAGGAG